MQRRFAPVVIALAILAGCNANITEPELAPAYTQENALESLTRADCIGLAMHSAPTAAAWNARRLAARASLEQAGLLPNPTLSLGWEDFGLNQAASASQLQTTLSLAMALQDVFARKRRKAAAQEELTAAEADLRAEAMRLAAVVSHAYDQLVAARERAQLAQDLGAVAEHQRVDVEELVASGIAAHIQLERAEAEVAQSHADRAVAEAQARALELELAFSLGFERPVKLQLSDSLTDATPSPDLEADLTAAVSSRQEIAAAQARYRAERERLKLAAERVQFLPTVGAGPRKQGDELRGVATIDVALAIFDSGSAAENAQSAALLASAAALRSTARDVAHEVAASFEKLSASLSYLSDHANDLSDRRRTLRERTELLFRAGEVDYAELALTRRDEVQARIALLDARLAASSARVDLDAATGSIAIPVPGEPAKK